MWTPHASLDMTILTTSQGPNDVLAYSSHFELGEDTSNLKIAGLVFDGAIGRSDHSSLKAIVTQVNVRRREPLESGADPNDADILPLDLSDFSDFWAENIDPSKLAGSDVVEHKHFSSIVIALEELVTNHTNAIEPNDGSRCKPLLSEVNNILLLGDSSIRSFQGLRRALAQSNTLSRMRVPDVEAESWVEIGAKGAVINARERMLHDAHDDVTRSVVHQARQV